MESPSASRKCFSFISAFLALGVAFLVLAPGKLHATPVTYDLTLTDAANSPRWQGILQVTRDQIVSSDIIGQPFGATVPLDLIKVIDGDLVKVLSWYDNEAGYVSTLIKHVEKVAEIL